jgi:hypothetical protein
MAKNDPFALLKDCEFSTIQDSRRLLSIVTRSVMRDKLDHAKAKLLIYCATSLVNVFEKLEIEKGLAELRDKLDRYDRATRR